MASRWFVLIVTPYGLVPTLAFLFITPTFTLWGISAQYGLTDRLSDAEFGWGVLLACGLSVTAAILGSTRRGAMGPLRKESLSVYLAMPRSGDRHHDHDGSSTSRASASDNRRRLRRAWTDQLVGPSIRRGTLSKRRLTPVVTWDLTLRRLNLTSVFLSSTELRIRMEHAT